MMRRKVGIILQILRIIIPALCSYLMVPLAKTHLRVDEIVEFGVFALILSAMFLWFWFSAKTSRQMLLLGLNFAVSTALTSRARTYQWYNTISDDQMTLTVGFFEGSVLVGIVLFVTLWCTVKKGRKNQIMNNTGYDTHSGENGISVGPGGNPIIHSNQTASRHRS